MTYQDQVNKFRQQCSGLIQEMHDWFHGLGNEARKQYTPEQAFQVQMQEQAKTLQDQLAFAKRAIQDGRKAQEFLHDEFHRTLLQTIHTQFQGMADKALTTAKSMEDVAYARGWKDGATEFFSKLEGLVRIGKGAEEVIVSLTKQGQHIGGNL